MKRSLAVMMFASSVLVGASVAHAGGNVFYSGQMCQVERLYGPANYSDYGYLNDSSSYQYVHCPLTYAINSITSFSPEHVSNANIDIYEAHGDYSNATSCRLVAVNWDGSLRVGGDVADAPTTPGFHTINLQASGQVTPLTGIFPHSQSIRCILTQGSTIYGYNISYVEQ